MKKILLSIFFLFSLSANAMEKETTFKKELFDKAQSDGKIVVISSWIKYCPSCAGQMKILQNAKNKGCLLYTSPSPGDKRQSRMPSSA